LDTILKLSKTVLDFCGFNEQVTKQKLQDRIVLTGLFVGFTNIANQQVSALRGFSNGFGLWLFHVEGLDYRDLCKFRGLVGNL